MKTQEKKIPVLDMTIKEWFKKYKFKFRPKGDKEILAEGYITSLENNKVMIVRDLFVLEEAQIKKVFGDNYELNAHLFEVIEQLMQQEEQLEQLKQKEEQLMQKEKEIEELSISRNSHPENKLNRLEFFHASSSSSETSKIDAKEYNSFHPSIIEAMKAIHSNDSIDLEKYQSLINTELEELHFDGVPLTATNELFYSSDIGYKLNVLFPQKIIRHQFPLFYKANESQSPNGCDILVLDRDSEKKIITPTAVIQVGMGSNTNKFKQTLAYVNLATRLANFKNPAFCCMEWIVGNQKEDYGKLVKLHFFISRIDLTVPLYKTICQIEYPSILQIARVVNAFISTSTYLHQNKAYFEFWEKRGTNVAIDFKNKRVYKFYDYTDRIDILYKRSPEHYPIFLSSYNPTIEKISPNCQILSYDLIIGFHIPKSTRHLLDLCLKIQKIHDKYLVHGDLRLYNLIFKDLDQIVDSYSEVIDLDYLCMDTYPDIKQVSDTVRHQDVKLGKSKLKKHDTFSLGKIFDFFQLIDEEIKPKQDISNQFNEISIEENLSFQKKQKVWDDMIKSLVINDNLEEAINKLKKIQNMRIQPK